MEISFVITIAFLAAFIQGLTGFGSALLGMPLLLFQLDIKTAIPLMSLMGLVMNNVLFIKLRSYFKYQRLIPLLISSIAGIPIGILGLKNLPENWLKLILAAIILSYALYSLINPVQPIQPHPKFAWLAGFISGCLGGAFNISGPPVVLWGTMQNWPKQEFRSTLQSYFALNGMVIAIAYAVSGLTTAIVVQYFLFSIPAILVGIAVGNYYSEKLSQARFKQLVLVMLIALALMMLFSIK